MQIPLKPAVAADWNAWEQEEATREHRPRNWIIVLKWLRYACQCLTASPACCRTQPPGSNGLILQAVSRTFQQDDKAMGCKQRAK